MSTGPKKTPRLAALTDMMSRCNRLRRGHISEANRDLAEAFLASGLKRSRRQHKRRRQGASKAIFRTFTTH
eukprot:COSAG03_NODE_998_length_5064_cov_6.269889_5_plen_71_part_00